MFYSKNQRIKFTDGLSDTSPEYYGNIAGEPVNINGNYCWPVLLDNGFFSEDRKFFVSVLLVNHETIAPI